MSDITLHNVPGFGNVTIKDEPKWLRAFWFQTLGIAEPKKAWVPTFEEVHYSGSPDAPPLALNADYYATEETAKEIMRRFDAVGVIGVPSDWTDGVQRWVVFSDGVKVNAGLLAAQFIRNPEDLYPGVAEANCRKGIESARRG